MQQKKNLKSLGCNKHPCYGLPGARATHCADCFDKSTMLNVIIKKYDHPGCTISASFGLSNATISRCKKHADPGMMNKKIHVVSLNYVMHMQYTNVNNDAFAATEIFPVYTQWSPHMNVL